MPTKVTTTVQVKSVAPGVGGTGSSSGPSTPNAGMPMGLLIILTRND